MSWNLVTKLINILLIVVMVWMTLTVGLWNRFQWSWSSYKSISLLLRKWILPRREVKSSCISSTIVKVKDFILYFIRNFPSGSMLLQDYGIDLSDHVLHVSVSLSPWLWLTVIIICYYRNLVDFSVVLGWTLTGEEVILSIDCSCDC